MTNRNNRHTRRLDIWGRNWLLESELALRGTRLAGMTSISTGMVRNSNFDLHNKCLKNELSTLYLIEMIFLMSSSCSWMILPFANIDDPYLWKFCSDQFCHSASIGKHYGSHWTTRKVLDNGFYWPTIFKDVLHVVTTREYSLLLFVWSLMFGVLISWVHFLFLMVEAKATKTNDAKVVVDFLRSNIFCNFGVPKALVTD
ncbi:hypothetical protein CR513_31738, partial [Mucuna pruriens]